MSDLLPCPFCGGEASAVEDISHSTAYAVGCFNGKCALEPYVWDVSKTKAIAAWNRRAIPAADARAEALREAAELVDKRHRGNLPDHIKSEDGNAIRAMIEETKT